MLGERRLTAENAARYEGYYNTNVREAFARFFRALSARLKSLFGRSGGETAQEG